MSDSKFRFIPKSIVKIVFACLLIAASISVLTIWLIKTQAAPFILPPTACTPTYTKTPYDFDGDCMADPSVWKPAESTFVTLQSTQGTTVSELLAGHHRDRIIPADYDGDGKTDFAVFTEANRSWHIKRSLDNQIINFIWGAMGDLPVPGDFDGDGKADIAVWRPSTGVWYIVKSSTQNQSWEAIQFGARGDVPVVGDYDGDGRSDAAVWRPSDGTWYLLQSQNGFTGQQWGLNGDVSVAADYDGDKKTDVAVWRPSVGEWYVLKSSNGSFAYIQWGASIHRDVMVPADYDGDGKADYAVWRPADGAWYIIRSSDLNFYSVQHGAAGNTPVLAGGKCIVSNRICWENTYNLNYNSSPTEWQIPAGSGAFAHEIEGYASKTSVNVGDPISFHLNVNTPGNVKIEIYRMGWYGGAGASLQHLTTIANVQPQIFAEANRTTGLIEYNWTPVYSWTPPAGTASGFFIAKLTTPANGKQSYIVLAAIHIAASVRHQTWLIPAVHCAIDDPQNFDLRKFVQKLKKFADLLKKFAGRF